MKVTINNQDSDAYIYNLAFIKAICIKEYVKSLPVPKEEKEKILKSILQILRDS